MSIGNRFNEENMMKTNNFSQNKYLVTSVIVLVLLCILIIGTKIAVEQSVKNQLVLVGEQLTGRKFQTDSVTYHPLFFDLVITGLKMKNPPGYSGKNPAAEINSIRITISPWAILHRRVHIRKIRIDGVRFYPELKKIPLSVSDLISIIMNPEINLVDIEKLSGSSSVQKETGNSGLWLLKIDDLTITDVEVHFINFRNFKQMWLPVKLQDYLPHILHLKSYRQLNLGADGKHTGPMIAGEILDRHIEELKQWYETKKEAILAEIKKYLPGKKEKK